MSPYELTIELSPEDTETLNEKDQVVALVPFFGDSHAEMIWVQLAPFETNLVTWGSELGLYASPDAVEQEGAITASSTVHPAKAGCLYPFANGVFGAPVDSSS